MYRSGLVLAGLTLLVCSSFVQADISPIAEYIQNRPYKELSTDNPIGSITAGDIDKASGIVASVCDGLVAWADGRSGRVAIMGFDLNDPLGSEFLISDETDDWQEGNPFVAYNAVGGHRWVVYDATDVSNPGGDTGDIQGSALPPAPTWLVQSTRRQRSPVSTNVVGQEQTSTILAWIDYPGSESEFPGYANTDIYTATVVSPITTPLPGLTNITTGKLAHRDALTADGRYLGWQELRYDEVNDVSSWDLVVYDLGGTYANPDDRFRYIDGADSTKNQIAPDISGNLLAWTQEEDPSGTGATNVYFQDLASGIGPVAVTLSGDAKDAAISVSTVEEDGRMVETCFVVWQDHHEDDSTSLFGGAHGETDYNWDIWAQELRVDADTGEWALYKDGFLIYSDIGRQTLPDIDGLDVVWQSQAPNSEDIYVWGAQIPEPCTVVLVIAGIPFLLARRRRSRK